MYVQTRKYNLSSTLLKSAAKCTFCLAGCKSTSGCNVLVGCCVEEIVITLSSAGRSEVGVPYRGTDRDSVSCRTRPPDELASLQSLGLPAALQFNSRMQMTTRGWRTQFVSEKVLVWSSRWQHLLFRTVKLRQSTSNTLSVCNQNTPWLLSRRCCLKVCTSIHIYTSHVPLYDFRLAMLPLRVAIQNSSLKHTGPIMCWKCSEQLPIHSMCLCACGGKMWIVEGATGFEVKQLPEQRTGIGCLHVWSNTYASVIINTVGHASHLMVCVSLRPECIY